MGISRRFLEAVKLAPEPSYRLAWRAGLHPSTLSKILHGAVRVGPRDPRVLAIAKVLGLDPAECFAEHANPVRTPDAGSRR
jgi:lambda repressor-like predicted transcriptional regulator